MIHINGIIKRGNSYSVVVYLPDENGVKKQKWFSFKTESEACSFRNSFFGETKPTSKYKHILVSEYIFNWLETYSVRQDLSFNTVRGYRKNFEHVASIIGHLYIDELNADIMQYLFSELLKKNLSPSSQLYVYRSLNRCFKLAFKREDIPKNYCELIDSPKKNKISYTCFNAEQLSKYIAYLDKSENTLCALFFLFVSLLGVRRGEALGLRWSDINFQDRFLRISRSASPVKGGYKYTDCKTEKSRRDLIIPNRFYNKLCLFKGIQQEKGLFEPNGDVFLNDSGKLVSPYKINTYFKKSLADNGFPDMRIHDLRHSFATLLVASKKTDIATISQMLGHSKVSTTLDIYTHPDIERQRDAVSLLDSL